MHLGCTQPKFSPFSPFPPQFGYKKYYIVCGAAATERKVCGKGGWHDCGARRYV
jgi:hypothetical protein